LVTDGEQQSLFTAAEQRGLARFNLRTKPSLDVTEEALRTWKASVYEFQQTVRAGQPIQQVTLFPISSTGVDPATIDPFELEFHNFFFFNWPADRHPGDPCIYFVVDSTLPLLLYVGETCHANQRWKGVHDCKQYVLNYQSLHFKYQMPTAINTAFWWDTPAETGLRQALESGLISRWKSPFNKENWRVWQTPFVADM
jgi:hypothetical protein